MGNLVALHHLRRKEMEPWNALRMVIVFCLGSFLFGFFSTAGEWLFNWMVFNLREK